MIRRMITRTRMIPRMSMISRTRMLMLDMVGNRKEKRRRKQKSQVFFGNIVL